MSKQFNFNYKSNSRDIRLRRRKSEAAKFNESFSKGFVFIGSNGSEMIISILLKLKMKKLLDDKDPTYYLKWTDVAQQVDWGLHVEFDQIINHIPNSELITNKGNLLHSLRQYDRLCKALQRSSVISIESFVPESYMINNPKELSQFYENIENSRMWIYKPTGLNQGIGISLIRDKGALEEVLYKDQNNSNKYRRPMGKIIQRYIMNPLLIKNKKFDIRAYMLIANTTPFLILYHPGYLRLSIENYSNESDDLLIHLTNQFIQKKDPKYKDVKDDTVWSMEQFNLYFNDHIAEYPKICKNWGLYVLNNKMKGIMRQVFFSVKNKLSRGVGSFELFGFDFMIDAEFKVWLIEVNMNPAMNTNCEVLKEKLPKLIQNTLEVSIECFEKCKIQENLLPLKNQGNFEVIYYEDNWNWQQYITNKKDILSSLKLRKLSNKHYQKDPNERFLIKRSKSPNNTVFSKQRSQSVPLPIERRFPLNITNKNYKELVNSQYPPMSEGVKT